MDVREAAHSEDTQTSTPSTKSSSPSRLELNLLNAESCWSWLAATESVMSS